MFVELASPQSKSCHRIFIDMHTVPPNMIIDSALLDAMIEFLLPHDTMRSLVVRVIAAPQFLDLALVAFDLIL